MEFNLKNYLRRPPLPGRKRTQLHIESSLQDVMLPPGQARDNYLLPRIDKFLQVSSKSIQKVTPVSQPAIMLKQVSCQSLLHAAKRYAQKAPLFSQETILLEKNNTFRQTSYDNSRHNASSSNAKIRQPSNESKGSVAHHSVRSQGKNLSLCSEDESAADGSENWSTTPRVSAKSWIIYQMKRKKYIHGKRIFKKREIASLTKIMNIATVLDTLIRLGLDPKKIFMQIGPEAEQMSGTSAQLKKGMIMSVYDLLFGMMLPSGNDAALCLSQAVGTILCVQSKGKVDTGIIYNQQAFTQLMQTKRNNSVTVFLSQMNRKAKSLGMFNSNFANVHGLSQTNNLSSAQDVAKLCSYCMCEYDLFRRVVSTTTHKVIFQRDEQIEIQEIGYLGEAVTRTEIVRKQESMVWENTNKLLVNQNWSGIKTGITPNAGPCLAASVNRVIGGTEYSFLVVLLSSVSMEARWKQSKALVHWVLNEKLY